MVAVWFTLNKKESQSFTRCLITLPEALFCHGAEWPEAVLGLGLWQSPQPRDRDIPAPASPFSGFMCNTYVARVAALCWCQHHWFHWCHFYPRLIVSHFFVWNYYQHSQCALGLQCLNCNVNSPSCFTAVEWAVVTRTQITPSASAEKETHLPVLPFLKIDLQVKSFPHYLRAHSWSNCGHNCMTWGCSHNCFGY